MPDPTDSLPSGGPFSSERLTAYIGKLRDNLRQRSARLRSAVAKLPNERPSSRRPFDVPVQSQYKGALQSLRLRLRSPGGLPSKTPAERLPMPAPPKPPATF